MPPQQVFCVQEILAEILNKIRDDPRDDGATAHRSLARLARTCKTISDLALDALWYRQFSLEPFLHLLGDAIAEQKVSKDRFEVWITICTRPPSWSEWQTFFKYSSRVRILETSKLPSKCRYLDKSVFVALSLTKVSLFPNLRRLTWPCENVTQDSADDPAVLAPFISKELQEVEVDLLPDSPAYPSLLQKLHLDCPQLRGISLQCGDNIQSFLALSDYLLDSRYLERFKLTYPFHSLLWDATAQMPHLRVLDISLPEDTSGRLLSKQTIVHPFPALQGLHILSPDIRPLNDFLACYSYQQIQSLSIYLEDEIMPTEALILELVSIVQSRCGRSTLRKLVVHSDGLYEEDMPIDAAYIVHPHTLRPLFSFEGLTNLCLGSRWCMDLDNSFIRDISIAWPNIVAMRLFENAIWPTTSKVTLAGLLPLARRCTKLELFGVALNASGPPVSPPGEKVVQETLTVFYFGCSPIDDVPSTAAFLSEVFPNLSSLDSWSGSGHLNLEVGSVEYEYRKRWRAVEKLLAA